MTSSRVLCASFLFGILQVTAAYAQLPADQTVQWRFHQTPSIPSSPVELRVIATLKALVRSKNNVGWEVQSLEFFHILPEGTKSWAESFPDLGTPDGLWWVTHAHYQTPVLNEFINSPLLEGVAAADDPADDDLTYSLRSSPAMIGVYPHTSEVTYAIASPGPYDPFDKSGDDEIVEVYNTRDVD